ncbi:hypothetical protein UPYG_G00129610 [Umbra pygmaea]|uniref:Solute carrier family 46 member 3 n=1 Tax=Umbra pygmaea TaxID=75934 RepID=A0ABD0X6R2_UMBPY
MVGVFLIEPVVGVYAFSMFMHYPLIQQYVYRRMWHQITGAPYPTERNSTHCTESSSNVTSIHEVVQKDTSLFLLYSELCFLFPSLISSLLLVSYSDHRGRKVALLPPLVGELFFALSYATVSRLSLSLSYLLAASFLTGILGGPTALMGASFAYIADLCERAEGKGGAYGGVVRGGRSYRRDKRGEDWWEEKGEGGTRVRETGGDGGIRVRRDGESDGKTERWKDNDARERYGGKEGGRTVRMAVLDMLLGVLSGLASLCTGFYIRAAGFTWPFFTVALLHLLNLLYAAAVLQETMVTPSSSSPTPSAPRLFGSGAGSGFSIQREALIGRLQGVYLLFATSSKRRATVLVLLLAAFASYKISTLGGMSIFILYELNAPLCWSEVLVGYGSAMSTLIYLASFTGVFLLSRWIQDGYMVLLGLLSVAAGLLMAVFAKTTLLMLLVRVPLLLSIMPTPVLRSMMSKIVLSSEQGAVFACVAFVEMLSVGVGFTVFSSVYANTVSWFHGFSFMLASAITLIPAVLIGVVMCLRLDKDEEASRLTAEDEGKENNGQSLQLPHLNSS